MYRPYGGVENEVTGFFERENGSVASWDLRIKPYLNTHQICRLIYTWRQILTETFASVLVNLRWIINRQDADYKLFKQMGYRLFIVS